jgi:hypothetical protein
VIWMWNRSTNASFRSFTGAVQCRSVGGIESKKRPLTKRELCCLSPDLTVSTRPPVTIGAQFDHLRGGLCVIFCVPPDNLCNRDLDTLAISVMQ